MFKNLNPTALGVTGHQSEIIELALTYGFAGIDLNIAEFATRARLKGLPYAKRLIQSGNVRIGTFALPFDVDTDDETFQKELKKLPEYVEAAAALGCTRCTTTLAPAGDTRPYHENFEFHRHRLSDICGVLQSGNVRLAVGFQAAEKLRQNRAFQFIHDLDALSLLVNMAAAPNIGLLLDIWEVFAAGGSLDAVHKIPKEQIVAVQIADMPANVALTDLDEKSRLLPGGENGRIDCVAFFAMLRELGYDGPITLKPSRTVFPNRRRDAIVKMASDVLDKTLRAASVPLPSRPVPTATNQIGEDE